MARLNGPGFERRASGLLVVFAVAFVGLLARQAHIQFVDGAAHRRAVEMRMVRRLELPARRGRFLDRAGREIARSTEAYQLYVFPVRFRETNRIDALHDLAVALFPERVDWLDEEPTSTRAEILAARLRRFLGAWENRADVARAIANAPVSAIDLDGATLAERWGSFLYPRGELVLPPTHLLRRRLLDCLVILAQEPELATREAVANRLDDASTIGEALGLDDRAIARAVEDEYAELEWLAGETDGLDVDAFLYRLFDREEDDRARLVRAIESVIDDRICLARHGTHDLAELSSEQQAELARELGLPGSDDDALWRELLRARSAVAEGEGVEPELQGLLALFADVGDREALGRSPRFERRALARALGLWSSDPLEIERAVGRRVRAEPGYDEADYLSFARKWSRIRHFKGGQAWRLGSGWSFETADRVWRAFGLGRAGFEVHAGWRRQYWRDEEGFSTLLIGRQSSENEITGGLEAALGAAERRARADREDLRKSDPAAAASRAARDLPRRGRLPPASPSRRRRLGDDGREPVAAARPGRASLHRPRPAARGRGPARSGRGGHRLEPRRGRLRDRHRHRGDRHPRLVRRGPGRARVALLAPAHRAGPRPGFRQPPAARGRAGVRGGDGETSGAPGARRGSPLLGSLVAVLGSGLAAGFGGQDLHRRGHARGRGLDPDRVVHDTDKGDVDLHQALVKSSNEYFRDQRHLLGEGVLFDWFESFGLFQPTPHLVSRRDGGWRSRAARGDGSTLNSVIGQGSISTTPLEIADMMATLARRGHRVAPRIVLSGPGSEETAPAGVERPISESTWRRLSAAMEEVAEHYGHDAARAVGLAGKTGTADGFLGTRWAIHNQAWFAGVFPVSAPRYAFAMTSLRTRQRGKFLVPFCVELARITNG
ncbi:MAG: penicillin-binding transpeptidase domain-containing protein [Planctomycetota bacterium]